MVLKLHNVLNISIIIFILHQFKFIYTSCHGDSIKFVYGKKGIFFWNNFFWKFRENSKELPAINKLPETNEIIQN